MPRDTIKSLKEELRRAYVLNEQLRDQRSETIKWLSDQCQRIRNMGIYDRISLYSKPAQESLNTLIGLIDGHIDNIRSEMLREGIRMRDLEEELKAKDAEIIRLKALAFDRFIDNGERQ